MWFGNHMRKVYIFFPQRSSLFKATIEHCRSSRTNFGIRRYWQMNLHHNALIYLDMIYGASPEPFQKIYPNLIPNTIRNTHKCSQYFEDNSSTATRFLLIFLSTKNGYSNWIQTITKFQMREVFRYIQLNCHWHPPWKTGALRQTRPLLLAPDFPKLFSRADSNEARLGDGLSTVVFLQH